VESAEARRQCKAQWQPSFINHLEFRGNISETGYRSDFPFSHDYEPSLDEVKETAQARAQQFYNENPAKYGLMKHLF